MTRSIKTLSLSLLIFSCSLTSVCSGLLGWLFNSPGRTTQRTTSQHVSNQTNYSLSFLGKLTLAGAGLAGLHGLNSYGRAVTGSSENIADGSHDAIEAYRDAFSPIGDGAKAFKQKIQSVASSLPSLYHSMASYGHHGAFGVIALLSLLLMYDTCDPAPQPRAIAFGRQQPDISLHQRIHSINKKLRLSSGSLWSVVLGVPAAVLCYDMFHSNACGSLMPTSLPAAGVAAVIAAGLSSYSLRELFGQAQQVSPSRLNRIAGKIGNGIECVSSYALAIMIANMLYGAHEQTSAVA